MENEVIKPEIAEVVDIQFRPGQKIYFFDPAGIACKAGDHLIIDTARGPEFGYCTAGNHKIPAKDVVAPLRPVIRKATEQDEKIAAENQAKEKKAADFCARKILEMQLDMQLVSAECAFDGSKLLFFFTADERVDFRELVKELASVFHTRIELRQIGVRDKAKMVGGLGICGRPFCCATFLDDFQPVSIKMAKTQNLSLSPTKISGTCGRLMCCLKYEQDAYEDLIRRSPKAESFVDTPDGRGTVVELDLLRQRVKVRMEDRPEMIGTYANTDIAVLRNGKAKKTDPPIPADLAPISGGGRRRKKEEETDTPVMLDSIRLRYSNETIAEQQAAPEPEQEKTPRAQNRNRRRGKPGGEGRPEQKPQEQKQQEQKPQQKKPAPKAEPQQKKPAQTGEATGEKEAPKKSNRRPRYRRRKPASGGGSEG